MKKIKTTFSFLVLLIACSCNRFDAALGVTIDGTIRGKVWIVTAPNTPNGNIGFNQDGSVLCSNNTFVVNGNAPIRFETDEPNRGLKLVYANQKVVVYEVAKYLPSTVTLKVKTTTGQIETVVLSR